MYYDRKNILDTLIRRVNSFSDGYRQNIALLGEPSIGKTTVIKNLLASDSLKKDFLLPIYIEIKIEPFEFYAKRFIKSALTQLIKSDSLLAAPQETVLLIGDLAQNYPKLAQICTRVLQDIEKSKFDEAFSFMMDIPMILSEETKKRCILILDEFHNLSNFALKNPFGILAKKIMIQKDTMYTLVSSKTTLSQRLLSEKLSLLFGNFEKIILSPFDISISRVFLQNNITGAVFPPSYLDFIASFTGNRPFYMQAICDEIERGVFSKKIAQDSHYKLIEHAFIETLFKKRGMINQHFSNLLFKISEGKLLSRSLSVLFALSSENKKQHDIIKASRLQSRDVSRILCTLTEMDMIARNGALYRFQDKLFHFWIQSVYLKRISSFSIEEELEENSFKKDLSNKFNLFMQEFEKECSSRVIELFRLFKNDVIQLNGKKHKFISFTDVQKIEEASNDSSNILAVSGRQKWLCTIKKKSITENDIAEIIKNTKDQKRHNKVNRNILVAFQGINENAYLMAKEAKFWTWDLETLNILMELYGKPHIINDEGKL